MSDPEGFTYQVRAGGEVAIFHHGRRAAVLRGTVAVRFLDRIGDADDQHLMARATGNYKRGNERR